MIEKGAMQIRDLRSVAWLLAFEALGNSGAAALSAASALT
jgi:hypothetical protein